MTSTSTTFEYHHHMFERYILHLHLSQNLHYNWIEIGWFSINNSVANQAMCIVEPTIQCKDAGLAWVSRGKPRKLFRNPDLGVATQDWLLSHDRSSAVPRLAAAHWMTHQSPTTIRWPVILQHKLPAEDRPLWPIRFDFRPKNDCRQNACEKEHLETWIMLCVKYKFVVIAYYFCTKTFQY